MNKFNVLSWSKSLKNFFFILGLILVTGCGSQTTVVHGLDEREANEIIVYLDNHGIKAQKVREVATGGAAGGGEVLWDINVDPSDYAESLGLLNAAGLPKRQGQTLLNIFSKSGLVPSEQEEKIRYQSGLAAQIASTLRKIDGVLDADVQISFPKENPLNPTAPKEPVTASVFVKHNGILDNPNSQLIPKIKRLVASSVPSLNYDDVTVVPVRARFAEEGFPGQNINVREGEKQFVSVWSLIISKESLTRFQTIFISFIALILLLLLATLWSLWKFHLLIPKLGGWKSLLNYHPYKEEVQGKEKEEKKEDKESKGEKGEAPPEDVSLEEEEEEEK